MTLNNPLGPPQFSLICLLCLLVSPLVAQTSFDRYIDEVAEKWKRSNQPILDEASMISHSTEQELGILLVKFQRQTDVAIAVVTLPNMRGGQLEDFTNRLYEQVGLGQAGEDKGVMLLVAQQERSIRIETGYGVEGDLTDLESKRIIDTLITPAFRSGRFSAGIDAGARAILNELQPGFVPAPTTTSSRSIDSAERFFILIFFLFLFALWALGLGRRSRYGRGRYRRGGRGIWYGGGGGFGSGGGFGGGGGGGFGGFGGGFSGGGGASGGW